MAQKTDIVNCVADGPKAGTNQYRATFGTAIDGWLTVLTNQGIGRIFLPLYGHAGNYAPDNPSTVLTLDSFDSLTPDDMVKVFGSPAPTLPVNILFKVRDPGTSADYNPDSDDQDLDANGGINGVTLPYWQLALTYQTAWKVNFDLVINAVAKTQWQNDGCGRRFQLPGGIVDVTANVNAIDSEGALDTVVFNWHAPAATIQSGPVNVSPTQSKVTLLLNNPGTVVVSVDATVTTKLGSGTQVERESSTQTAKMTISVLTEAEAALAKILCRLMQSVLPTRRFVFPGDPARRRLSPEQLRAVQAVAEHMERETNQMTREIHRILGQG